MGNKQKETDVGNNKNTTKTRNKKFDKWIEFDPAFDKRSIDPEKDYGVHGVTMRFILRGDLGAVQFVVYTNWMLPHVQEEIDAKPLNNDFPYLLHKPMPSDLGYHSPKPMYEDQICIDESCDYIYGKPCYYDGSTLNAEPIFDVLLAEGSDGVWRELEKYYNITFSDK